MSYRSELRAILKVRCAHLCTKAAVMPLPEADAVRNTDDTAVWWCAHTTEALGPDGSCAEPGACDAPGRSCYEPPRPG